jgi:homoserine dehydrogenase
MPQTLVRSTTAECEPGHSDAYVTTGTSPTGTTVRPGTAVRPRAYDRVHLVGPGAVGREFLRRLAADTRRLVAVTDSSGTVHDEAGLDARALVQRKAAGLPLADTGRLQRVSAATAIAAVDADIVVDATSTDLDRDGWTVALDAALKRGACVVSAAKASLCSAGAEWLNGGHRSRVGCNAVLGGTGRSFVAELDDLRGALGAAIVGNASTTAIIETLEAGGSLEDGIADARQRGYLEPDPELDLRGIDAAVKLAIVAGVLDNRSIDPRSIHCDDIRELDPFVVRARRLNGRTTRLVARWSRADTLAVRYESVPRDSLLAAPCGRVVYEYRLARDERRFHIGTGLGASATAAALWSDVRTLAPHAALRAAQAGAR